MEKTKQAGVRLLKGGFLIGLMVFLFPPLWGEGFETIKSLFSGDYCALFANTFFEDYSDSLFVVVFFFLMLVLLKVCATAVTLGAGGVGGIFAPTLFSGAIAGFLFSLIVNRFIPDVHLSQTNFILVGMGAVLAGVLHAPLTGIFLIAEITSGYDLIVPLMLVSTLSYITVKSIEPVTIITKQLTQKGYLITHHKDKTVLGFMKLRSLIENDLHTIDVNATLGDLVEVISKSKRNLFPVVSSDNFLAGVILLDDVRELMFQPEIYSTTYVRNLMTLPPTFVSTTDTMDEVIRKFNSTNSWNLPVVERGLYIGFVSKSKMFEVYRKLLVEMSED